MKVLNERIYGPDSDDGFTLEEVEDMLDDARSLGMTHMLGKRATFVRYKPQTTKEFTNGEDNGR